jgi:DNA-binding SARP family transcriptional activator
VDDLREDVHRRLMGCRLATGQRAKALEQYRELEEMLERELGVGPSAETVAMCQNTLGQPEDAA